MTFSRKYLLWLILPPPALTLPLSLFFLSQLVDLTGREWLLAITILILVGALGEAIFVGHIRESLRRIDEEGTEAGSETLSECLRQTATGSVIGWAVGTFLFALLGMLLFVRTPLGFAYFLVPALGSAAPSICWNYAAGKRMLQGLASGARIHYVGRTFPLGRKIAIVFIGFFVISAAALVLLISRHVSSSLEDLAISSARDSFDGVYAVARGTETLDQAALDSLLGYVPGGYAIHRVAPDGSMLTASDGEDGEPLTADEVRTVLRERTGDSRRILSPHVMIFGPLEDGSVLALSIPWRSYREIPYQVAFYTLIISAMTMAIFVLATYFLSTDVNQPLRRLTSSAEAMAKGNFSVKPWVFSDDEIGVLAERFGETRAQLEGLIRSVGSSGRSMTEGVYVIRTGASSLQGRSKEQAELTESSSVALGRAREGAESVLRAAEQVSERTQDASSRALELQASSEEVARSMVYLFQSVEKTSSSTTEMDASAREMSGRTSFLADIGEEVLSFVTQMDSTIEELRKRAAATAELSRKVTEEAQTGGAAIGETMEGIRSAQESSRRTATALDDLQGRIAQIGQILNVIEEVTERTNLLSLNAAIIAAQAGEHGAGFSVVAGEIRELADRTRGSTKEIGGIVKAVQNGSREAVRAMEEGVQKVDQNVALVQNAARSLGKILTSSNESYEMADRISAALEEQTAATRHLHEVTTRMSDHISEINRSTQEQARGTKLLAEEAERVREIALQVRNSTEEQSTAGQGITGGMEEIATEVRRIRDLLEGQLGEMQKIAEASQSMLIFAQRNEILARDFESSIQGLVRSSRGFEVEVAKFKLDESG